MSGKIKHKLPETKNRVAILAGAVRAARPAEIAPVAGAQCEVKTVSSTTPISEYGKEASDLDDRPLSNQPPQTTFAAVISLLHEPAIENSATRHFQQSPVLFWTLNRIGKCTSLKAIAIFCWDDQFQNVQHAVRNAGENISVITKGTRHPIACMDVVTIARKWTDGWRGGLFQACDFDRGFYGKWVMEIVNHLSIDAAVLIDPAAVLIDQKMLADLLRHADKHADQPLVFTQAAPGLCGVVIRKSLLAQLADANLHAGKFLHYQPSLPSRDPISETSCMPVPTPVARCVHRLTVDSTQQIQLMERVVAQLEKPEGRFPHLPFSPTHSAVEDDRPPVSRTSLADELFAEQLVTEFQRAADSLIANAPPREVIVEVTTQRMSKPVFLPAGSVNVDRANMSPATARQLFGELAKIENLRLTLGGVGDPLLHPQLIQIIQEANRAGLKSIHLRTDLLELSQETLEFLTTPQADGQSPVDILSIQIPAVSAQTYVKLMRFDGLSRVLDHVRKLVEHKWARQSAGPIIVPVFTKCNDNLAEMDTWYDKWLAAMGSAVIAGTGDFAGQIPNQSPVDMTPPIRRGCSRLNTRMNVLSDGSIVACEQDFLGVSPLGKVGEKSINDIWENQIATLRQQHAIADYSAHPLCGKCKDWHR